MNCTFSKSWAHVSAILKTAAVPISPLIAADKAAPDEGADNHKDGESIRIRLL